MGLLNWSEEKIRKLTIREFALLKIVLVMFGIMIGAYISTFVKQNIMYFIGVFVILYSFIMYRILNKK